MHVNQGYDFVCNRRYFQQGGDKKALAVKARLFAGWRFAYQAYICRPVRRRTLSARNEMILGDAYVLFTRT